MRLRKDWDRLIGCGNQELQQTETLPIGAGEVGR